MIHRYKQGGYNIVLDTASGSVHSTDEVAYDIIGMYKTNTPEEIVSEIMKKYGEVTVIAPKHHQSGMSMAVSLGCIVNGLSVL